MSAPAFSGVLVPVLTPFTADYEPDAKRFVAYCKRLLDAGADGLAIFGTTSEANSLSLSERLKLLEALLASGVPASKLMPGSGACALSDAALMMRELKSAGCGGTLLLPPFYYKAITEDGLFDFTANVIERTGGGLPVYLYHIPPVAVVGWSHALVARLVEAFPDVIAGIKDSSTDMPHTLSLIKTFPSLAIFPGSETYLLEGLRAGGAGCISASANVNVPGIRRVIDAHKAGGGDAEQARVSLARKIIEGYPPIPAMKAMIATDLGDPDWARVRPPFRPLAAEKASELLAKLDAEGFGVGGPGVLRDAA